MQPYYQQQDPYAQQMYNQNQQYYNPNQMGYNQQQYELYQQQQQPAYYQQGIPLNYAPDYQQEQNMYQDQNIYAKQQQNNNSPDQIIVKPEYLQKKLKTETHSHHPREVFCKNCNKPIVTQVQYEIGLGTWTMVLLLCCCFWPLMFIPCCINSMKDVVHYCPNCGSFCGTKKFLC